jgi:hypothetical protein
MAEQLETSLSRAWRVTVSLGCGGFGRGKSMGLPARQRRILERTEGALGRSDPKLAMLFSTFGRLTQDEAMPCREAVKHGFARALAWLRRLPSVRIRRSRLRAQPGLLFLPLALVVLAGTIALAAITSTGDSCSGARQAAATRQVANSTSRACSPTAGIPGIAGKLAVSGSARPVPA